MPRILRERLQSILGTPMSFWIARPVPSYSGVPWLPAPWWNRPITPQFSLRIRALIGPVAP